jgi:serpin B
MEYGVKLLNDVLTDLGMGIAFSPQADFSNINPNLFISRVMHKAVIEVNEKGSEAAAATVVEVAESAMPVEEIIEFIVDRPFFFIIGDDRSGAVLFMGKVVNP